MRINGGLGRRSRFSETPPHTFPAYFAISQSVHRKTVSLEGFTPVHEKRAVGEEMNSVSVLQSEKKLVDVIGIEPVTPCLQISVAVYQLFGINKLRSV